MTFTVTYRGADGAVRSETFEASGRGECLAQCRMRGISPIGVKEGVPKAARGTRGSSARRAARTPKPSASNGRAIAYAVSAAFVLLLAGGAWWWMADGKKPAETELPAKVGQVKPVENPAVAARAKPMTEEERIFAETNGMSKGRLMQWKFANWKGPILTNGTHRVKTLAERTFPNSADRHLASLLMLKPGGILLGDSRGIFNARFLERFKSSLREPIIVKDDDDECVKELKRAVIDTKIELKRRMDSGEDICRLLAETRDEMQRLGEYRRGLQEDLRKAAKEGTLNAQDMEDYVKAANMMLDERGLDPIRMPGIYKRMLRLQATGLGESPKKGSSEKSEGETLEKGGVR